MWVLKGLEDQRRRELRHAGQRDSRCSPGKAPSLLSEQRELLQAHVLGGNQPFVLSFTQL